MNLSLPKGSDGGNAVERGTSATSRMSSPGSADADTANSKLLLGGLRLGRTLALTLHRHSNPPGCAHAAKSAVQRGETGRDERRSLCFGKGCCACRLDTADPASATAGHDRLAQLQQHGPAGDGHTTEHQLD